MDYSARARSLRTKKHQANVDLQEKIRITKMEKSGNLSRDEYWRKLVHCEEDILEYYEIYYPEYTKELAKALARTMTKYITGKA